MRNTCATACKKRHVRQHSQRHIPTHYASQQITGRWEVKLVILLASTHCICLYICSLCQYLSSTYMHKCNLKMTVSTCRRNSWEDTIAVPLLWKILTWLYFCANMSRNPRLLGLRISGAIKILASLGMTLFVNT